MKNLLFKSKTISYKNASIVESLHELDSIHQEDVNIAIWERDVLSLKGEIEDLLYTRFEFKTTGKKVEIQNKLFEQFKESNYQVEKLLDDVSKLLDAFESISSAKSF